jgi:UDP-glucose 4-epimerase
MTAKTYLLTGGAGFIASHLTRSLLDRGDHVVALDNLSTGRLLNIDPFGSHAHYRFIQGSVLDEMAVDELVHQADVVVHLAAAVGVRLIVEQPLRSFTTNIRGSEIVVEAAHRYRRKLLIASTSEVYGKNPAVPLAETADTVIGPPSIARWAYATAKAVDEILAYTYHRERGLESLVVRFFNTVGPGQSPAYGMVIPRLVRQAIRDEPITVYGDGTQSRCFCHVSDVVDAVIQLLDRPEAIGEVFNIGSMHEISIGDLADRIVDLARSRSEVTYIPYDVAFPTGFEDMQRRVPDTTKLRSLTGWIPTRTLDDILNETIAEARAELLSDIARSRTNA